MSVYYMYVRVYCMCVYIVCILCVYSMCVLYVYAHMNATAFLQ